MFAHVKLFSLAVLIFSTLPIHGHFSTLYLSPLGKISTTVSCDSASLMSPNKDISSCKLSWIFLLMVVWWSSLSVDDGANILTLFMTAKINICYKYVKIRWLMCRVHLKKILEYSKTKNSKMLKILKFLRAFV